MAKVSNQAELVAALRAREALIQIINDFPLTGQILILHDVTIESVTSLSRRTLFKAAGYEGCLFQIQNRSTLRLTNIIIDGQAQHHSPAGATSGSLICVTDGALCLDHMAVLTNNTAYKGGGVWIRSPGMVCMNGGAIFNNHAVYGGGIYNDSRAFLLLTGGTVSQNHAEAGGGIYNAELAAVRLWKNADLGSKGVNTATLYAPGIYNGGNIFIEGLRDLANGVYLSSQSSVVRLEGPLAPQSRIQIDASGYVSPNDSGIPVVIAEAAAPYMHLRETDRAAFFKPPSGFEQWDFRLSSDLTKVLLSPNLSAAPYED